MRPIPSDPIEKRTQDAIPRSLSVGPWYAAWARVEERGESGHPTGGGGSALSQGATAIEGTSCGLGATLEGAAIGAYAEKYRFAPGFSVGCSELEKHLIASRSRRSVPILRSCMESQRYVTGSCARMLEVGTLAAAASAPCRSPEKVT